MTTQSAQSATFQLLYDDIAECLKCQASLLQLARKFLSLRLIGKPIKDKISSENSPDVQVEILLCAIDNSIKNDPDKFDVFVDHLSTDPVFEDIVRKLQETRDEFAQIAQIGMTWQNVKKKRKGKRKRSHKNKASKKLKSAFIILLICMCMTVLGALYAIDNLWNNIIANLNEDPCHSKQPMTFEKTLPRHNLPSRPFPFIGRETELKEITNLFYENKEDIIVINGPPAFGKSALAIHVGYSMLEKQIDIAYIDAPESSVFKWWGSKASSDVLSFSVEADTQSYLIKWVKSLKHTSLLILDNLDTALEQNRDSCLNFVQKLCESAQPQMLKVLITSQTHLTFLGRFQQFNLGELAPESAIDLLNMLTNVESDGSEKLVEIAGFCPLTIKVVAALLNRPKMQGSEWLLAELGNNIISTSCVDDTFPKNHCWKALMDIAYSKLSNETQDCGHYISFFPGSFSDVTRKKMLSNPDCLNKLVVSSLTEKYTHGINKVRYTMHRLIKDYFKNKASDVKMQKSFEMAFQNHFSWLAYNMISESDTFYSLGFFAEVHNWQHLVSIALSTRQRVSSELLISVAFVHSKHLLPTNVSWENLFHIYNTYDFRKFCHLVGETICSDVFAETIENMHKNTPLMSCSLLSTLSTDTIYRIEHLIPESQCYCDMQMNVINSFLLTPFFYLFLKCCADIAAHLSFSFFKSKYHHKSYTFVSQLISEYIFRYFGFSAVIFYLFFHPLTTHVLCTLEQYISHFQNVISLLGPSITLCMFGGVYYYYRNNVSKYDVDKYHEEFGKLGYFNMYIIVVVNIIVAANIVVVLNTTEDVNVIHFPPISYFQLQLAIASPYDTDIAKALVVYICIVLSSSSCFFYHCFIFEPTCTYKHKHITVPVIITSYYTFNYEHYDLLVPNNNIIHQCVHCTSMIMCVIMSLFLCILFIVMPFLCIYIYAYFIGYTSFFPFLH